jgi:hypothetical protein
MVKAVKSLLAVTIAFALIFSQTASLLGAVPSGNGTVAPKCCGHCSHCKGGACCAANGNPSSNQSAPAVPAHGLSQNDWQLVAAAVAVLQHSGRTDFESLPQFSICSPLQPLAAPLYQRNCSYLI